MEKKLSFNENADNYDRLRPRYCSELFADIAAYAGLKKGAAALEVGPGTGQATQPFLDLGCRVTAVEWTVFEVLAAVAALFFSIGVPVMRLNASITKLTVMLERVERDVAANREQLAAQRAAARASHEKLWRHNDEQDERLGDHETRLRFLEKARPPREDGCF